MTGTLPHRGIELLFTVAEEKHTLGAAAFDCSRLKAKEAYVLDCSDVIGSYSAQEPTLIDFAFTIRGKAAHAGFEPENGINAIAAAASAIVRIKQGWVTDRMNLNLGRIEGGLATNIVSEEVCVRGELRGAVHEEALALYSQTEQIFREEAEKAGAQFLAEPVVKLFAYQVKEDSAALSRYKKILQKTGIPLNAKKSFGGSDNNVLVRNGIDGICLYNPMHQIHTTQEYTTIEELREMTQIVRELMLDRT